MKYLLVVLLSTFLRGCVTTHMKQYLDKDIRKVVLDSGPPVNAMDMGNSVRSGF